MAKLVKQFNPMNFDPTQAQSQLPIGRHKVVISASNIKAAKTGNSGYLQFEVTVIEGVHEGSSGVDRLSLYHDNTAVVEIASKRFSAYCHVMNMLNPIDDSAQLHNIPFYVEVGKAKDERFTEIKKLFDVNGNEPGQQSMQPDQQAPQSSEQNQPSSGWGATEQPQQNQPSSGWGATEQPQQPKQPQTDNRPSWAK